MGIDLGGADTGMTEHLLYGQEIGAAFQKVGGKAVPEGMRTDGLVDAVAFGQFLDQEEDRLPAQPGAVAV